MGIIKNSVLHANNHVWVTLYQAISKVLWALPSVAKGRARSIQALTSSKVIVAPYLSRVSAQAMLRVTRYHLSSTSARTTKSLLPSAHKILDRPMIQKGNKAIALKIRWDKLSSDLATWEGYQALKICFPTFLP